MTSSMKKRGALTAAVLTAAGLGACGDGGHGTASQPAPPAPQQQNLDTAQLLALAQKPSETTTPINVNAGMLELTDTSDTAQPISVNAQ
jgi:hypothetical protein